METVRTHCKHKDCSYRKYLDHTPYCDYIGATGRPRNCPISKCDKYTTEKVYFPFDWTKKEF